MTRLTDKDLWNMLYDFTIGTQLLPEKLNIIETVMEELSLRDKNPIDSRQKELF